MSESMPNTPSASSTNPIGTLGASPSIEAASPSNEAKTFGSEAQGSVIMSPEENPEHQPSSEQGIDASEPTLPRLQRAAPQGGDGTEHRELRCEIPDSEVFPSSSPVPLSVEGIVDNGPVSMSCHDGDEKVHVQGSSIVMSGEQDDGKNCISTDIQPVDSETLMAEEKALNSSGDVESGLVIGEDDGPGVLHTGLESVLDNAGSMESCVEKDSSSRHEGSAFSASADAPGGTDFTNLVAENETEDLGEECVVKDAEHEADNGEGNNTVSEISMDKEEGHQLRETSFKRSGQIVSELAPESELRTSASSPTTEAVVGQDEDIQMSKSLPSSAIVGENNEQIAPANNIDSESHNVSIQSGGKENALSTTDSSSPSITEAATQSKDTEMTEAPPSSAELNTELSIQTKDSDSIDPASSFSQSDTHSIITLGEAKASSIAPSEKQTGDKEMSEVSSSPARSKDQVTVVPKVPKRKTTASTSQPSSQNQDILLTELKAIKIANIQARTAALEAEIEAKRAKLAEVTKDLKNPAAETVKKHIKLLHDYNDIRDVGQGLVGMIADNRGVRIGEIYGEFGVGVKD